jgi:hypothetical protein
MRRCTLASLAEWPLGRLEGATLILDNTRYDKSIGYLAVILDRARQLHEQSPYGGRLSILVNLSI